MSKLRWLLVILFAGSMSCKKPPEAPKRLDKLCGYLFGHVWDQDPAALQSGLSNLRDWLKHKMEATEDGYTVNRLTQKQVDALDSCDRSIDGLLGAAVATQSHYGIDPLNRALIDVPARRVYPKTDVSVRHNFEPDKDCYLDHECEHLRYDTATEQSFAFGVYVRSLNTVQHRWVETPHGTAHVYRTWLQRPADVNFDWLEVQSQFYVSAIIPWEDGTARLQATWAVSEFGGGPLPESTVLNQAIQTMRESDEDVQNYLDTH